MVVEHIHEAAKTEERETEDGKKETVEISPARDMVKINKRPVSLSDIHPLWTKHAQRLVPMKSIKSFTARCLWITRNRCSGFI